MWTPEGSTLLYTTADRVTIWRQRLAGAAPEKLKTFSDPPIVRLSLAPDGRSMLIGCGTVLRDAFLLINFQ